MTFEPCDTSLIVSYFYNQPHACPQEDNENIEVTGFHDFVAWVFVGWYKVLLVKRACGNMILFACVLT